MFLSGSLPMSSAVMTSIDRIRIALRLERFLERGADAGDGDRFSRGGLRRLRRLLRVRIAAPCPTSASATADAMGVGLNFIVHPPGFVRLLRSGPLRTLVLMPIRYHCKPIWYHFVKSLQIGISLVASICMTSLAQILNPLDPPAAAAVPAAAARDPRGDRDAASSGPTTRCRPSASSPPSSRSRASPCARRSTAWSRKASWCAARARATSSARASTRTSRSSPRSPRTCAPAAARRSSEWLKRSEGTVTPEEALTLRLRPGAPVYRFHRLRFADDAPMCLEYATIVGRGPAVARGGRTLRSTKRSRRRATARCARCSGCARCCSTPSRRGCCTRARATPACWSSAWGSCATAAPSSSRRSYLPRRHLRLRRRAQLAR